MIGYFALEPGWFTVESAKSLPASSSRDSAIIPVGYVPRNKMAVGHSGFISGPVMIEIAVRVTATVSGSYPTPLTLLVYPVLIVDPAYDSAALNGKTMSASAYTTGSLTNGDDNYYWSRCFRTLPEGTEPGLGSGCLVRVTNGHASYTGAFDVWARHYVLQT
jgi:hypothetical protein